jgi:tRNA modification GTPase
MDNADIIIEVESGVLVEKTENRNNTIRVINKTDMMTDDEILKWRERGYIPCSAVAVGGLAELKAEILSRFRHIDLEVPGGIITNTRQLACVKKANENLLNAKNAMIHGLGIDFITFDLQNASSSLEEIIGRVSSDDILNIIFNDFCIGK